MWMPTDLALFSVGLIVGIGLVCVIALALEKRSVFENATYMAREMWLS